MKFFTNGSNVVAIPSPAIIAGQNSQRVSRQAMNKRGFGSFPTSLLEFDTSKAIVDDEFIETAVEEYAILAVPGLADYLKKKTKVKLTGTNVTNKEVTAE